MKHLNTYNWFLILTSQKEVLTQQRLKQVRSTAGKETVTSQKEVLTQQRLKPLLASVEAFPKSSERSSNTTKIETKITHIIIAKIF